MRSIIISLFLTLPALIAAQVPQIADLPECDSDPRTVELRRERDALVTRRDDLKRRSQASQSTCSSVAEGSADERRCEDLRRQFRNDMTQYAADVRTFNDETLTACRIGAAAPAVDAWVIAPDGEKRALGSGSPIFLNSHVVTGPKGSLKVLLLDETVFTLGPNSDMILDEFVYDPNTHEGTIRANIIKGIFRFVSGHMIHEPNGQRVRFPSGAVGIRGTDFELQTSDSGDGILKLYSGELDVAPISGNRFILKAGHQVTFSKDGKFSAPVAVTTPLIG